MKDKGKGVEGSSVVSERSINPAMVVENPEPISAVCGLFEEYTPLEELMGGSSDEDDEEEEEEKKDDKDEKVFLRAVMDLVKTMMMMMMLRVVQD
ncbi:hypothetical protein HanIR_Chr01g0012091 [Helianthus annuus]|nr:hypothetical protein HanIR_Chr01g0012091 [Helianthus annuus]